MKEAIQRLQDAYNAGYIEKETLTNATSDCRTKFWENKFGIFTYWPGSWQKRLSEGLETNGYDGELIPIEPIAEVGAYIDRTPVALCITTACDNPEGVFKYFFETALDGGEVQELWTYGVEGVHWSTAAEEVCGVSYEEGQFHMLESREPSMQRHFLQAIILWPDLRKERISAKEVLIPWFWKAMNCLMPTAGRPSFLYPQRRWRSITAI